MEYLLCARYYILSAGADVLVREMENKHTWMKFLRRAVKPVDGSRT